MDQSQTTALAPVLGWLRGRPSAAFTAGTTSSTGAMATQTRGLPSPPATRRASCCHRFERLLRIVGIQLARDLDGESHVYQDRAGGVITVEYSTPANSDATPWASSTGWASAGSISGWAANTRNYYHFSVPVVADGLRITYASVKTCVDELEIYAI